MKYLFTIPIKVIGILLFAVSFSFQTKAQKNTDSPYSRYGIGLLNTAGNVGNFGQSGTAYAWRPFQYKPLVYDSLARSEAQLNDRGTNYINSGNPASFSNISLTTFEASILSRNVRYSSGSQERVASNTQLGHVAVAFPIAQKWGVGFGIKPYSMVGYDFIESGTVNGNNIDFQYEGSGGANEIFIGTAYQLSNSMSLGFNGKYLFGSILDDRRIIYGENTSNFFNTLDQRDIKISDFTFDIGWQYYRDLNKDRRLIVGAVVSPIDQLSASSSQLIRNYTGNSNFESFKDTAVFFEDKKTTLQIQSKYGLGVAYEWKKKGIISVDYTLLQGTATTYADGASIEDNNRLTVGYEKYNSQSSFGTYWKQMGYRLGFSYNSSVVRIQGEDVQEFGMSFGLSLPLRKSFSTLNIGMELGRRGKDDKGLTQEDFFNLQFGVTINDKWFIKRKYD